MDRLLKKIIFTGVTERPKGIGHPLSVRTSEFWKKNRPWKCSARLKNPYEIGRKMDISRSSVWRVAEPDLRLRTYERLSALL